MKKLHIPILLLCLWSISCGDDGNFTQPTSPIASDWLIPQNEVFNWGPGKDGIPSIDNPRFTKASEVDYLAGSDLVLGIRVGDVVKAYPHPILDWHEIVNDRIGEESIALTYCPLTGTGIGWDRVIEGSETEFGVSGLLYNTNLMPYDRASNSTWSQQRLDCVNGSLKGTKAELHAFIETSWSTWKEAFPDSEVLNLNTGFNRNYNQYPYGDYRTDNQTLLFPVSNLDDRLPAKERVLGVKVSSGFVAYPFNDDNSDSDLVEDTFNGQNLIVVRSRRHNYLAAFIKPENDLSYNLADPGDFPVLLKDSDGTSYDLLGYATDQSGKKLMLSEQFIGYWFSWGTFYPNIDLF